jgi:MFS family permease
VGLLAGAWADRSDRRRTMVVSDTVRAGLVLALVPAALAGSMPVLFVLATLQAVVGTFFSPARTAMISRVVPPEGLLAANSLGQLTRMVAGVAGAGVAGVVAGGAGVAWPVFVVDAATFLVSVGLVLRVTPAAGLPSDAGVRAVRERGMGGAVLDGLRLIARSTTLVAALGGIAVTMLGLGAINVLFIPFLVDELGASPAWAGPLEAAQTVAMVVAGAVLASVATRVPLPRLFTGGLAGTGVAIGLLAVVPSPGWLLPVMFAAGAFVMPVQATTTTIVQQATTDATRGRVAGALNASIQASSIASMAAAGILADVVGVRWVFVGGAAITLAAALFAAALFRRGRTREAPGAELEAARAERAAEPVTSVA